MNLKRLTIYFIFIISITAYSQQKPFEVTSKRNDDNSVVINYRKSNPGSSFVVVNFKYLDNCGSPKIVRKTVKGEGGILMTLRPSNPDRSIKYSYNYKYINGDHKAKPDNMFKYTLPFENGKDIEVRNLSYVGKRFGNVEPKNWKSFQFLVNLDETVYASRKGIVVDIEDDIDSNPDQEYSYNSKANYVIIEHEDGTLAKYGVLKKNSIKVSIGDKVFPATPIAIAGTYDKTENSQLRFSLYYLDPDTANSDNDSNQTLSNRKHDYAYVDPLFYVNEGSVNKLIARNNYKAMITNEIIEMEMTKREKKKMSKKKN